MGSRWSALILWVLVVFASTEALAKTAKAPRKPELPFIATIEEPVDPEPKVSGLSWATLTPIVQIRKLDDGSTGNYVTLEGKFSYSGTTLIIDSRPVPITFTNGFSLEMRLFEPRTAVDLETINETGDSEHERIYVVFEGKRQLDQKAEELKKEQRAHIVCGLANTVISYQDTRIPTVFEDAVTGKLSFTNVIVPPHIDAGVSAYFTLLPLHSSATQTFRFLGLNARAGYILPGIDEPWRVSLLGGIYYTTMLVPEENFGFTSLIGPQLFPVIRRKFKNGESAVGYFKYSPLGPHLSGLSFSNREIAAGGAYNWPMNTSSFSLTLDIADLAVVIDGVKIRSTSLSLGFGYGI